MTSRLDALLDVGALSTADVVVAQVLARRLGEADEAALVAAAYAARQVHAGHVCADLRAIDGTTVVGEASGADGEPRSATWPRIEELRAGLSAWAAVGRDESASDDVGLVWTDDDRLYLTRYLDYERRLARALVRRLAPFGDDDVGTDEAVRATLGLVFPKSGPGHDGQRLAAVSVLCGPLSVVVGGPGTGKTTTVVRILAALVRLAAVRGVDAPRVVLLAPTGKAGARLADSIRQGLEKLPDGVRDEVARAVPAEASTVHRALGFQPGDPTRFRHGPDNPLAADVVVLDEASMVDIALMTKVVEAVRPDARLVLLGDRDQLASVEAGAVLGDIARAGQPLPPYPAAFADDAARWLHPPAASPRIGGEAAAEASGEPAGELEPRACIGGSITQLTHSWRFESGGGIGQLAAALQRGDVDGTWQAFEHYDDVHFVESAGRTVRDLLAVHAAALVSRTDAATPADALERLLRFQILCAHRSGPWGVAVWNAEAERLLEARSVVRAGQTHYDGRPVLVRRNEPTVGLFNGDVGVVRAGDDGELRVWFPADDAPRALAPGRLPEHETVYAMTIHKSQGSEYDEVVVVLPEHPTPITTRELLYTGVTRAKRRVTVIGSRASVEHAVSTPVRRSSGLGKRLWGESP